MRTMLSRILFAPLMCLLFAFGCGSDNEVIGAGDDDASDDDSWNGDDDATPHPDDDTSDDDIVPPLDDDSTPTEVDADGDGWSAEDGDCNDSNAAVNPGAEDGLYNGADENCNGADAAIGFYAFHNQFSTNTGAELGSHYFLWMWYANGLDHPWAVDYSADEPVDPANDGMWFTFSYGDLYDVYGRPWVDLNAVAADASWWLNDDCYGWEFGAWNTDTGTPVQWDAYHHNDGGDCSVYFNGATPTGSDVNDMVPASSSG